MDSNVAESQPLMRIAAMSELMTLAAIFVEHNEKNPAILTIKRIQQLAQDKELMCFEPNVFRERMEKLLYAARRL